MAHILKIVYISYLVCQLPHNAGISGQNGRAAGILIRLYALGRVSKGKLPPQASHRTVREPLDSYGSYHSVKHVANPSAQNILAIYA